MPQLTDASNYSLHTALKVDQLPKPSATLETDSIQPTLLLTNCVTIFLNFVTLSGYLIKNLFIS